MTTKTNMNFAQLKSARPDHKTEACYFADTDGNVWFLFGATADSILAEQCYFAADGGLMWGQLQILPYDRFGHWIDRSEIINVDGEATYGMTAGNEPDRQGTETMSHRPYPISSRILIFAEDPSWNDFDRWFMNPKAEDLSKGAIELRTDEDGDVDITLAEWQEIDQRHAADVLIYT